MKNQTTTSLFKANSNSSHLLNRTFIYIPGAIFFKRLHRIKIFHSNLKVAISFFFLFSIAVIVQAATFTSVSNGSWNSSSTWDRNGTPDVDNWPND